MATGSYTYNWKKEGVVVDHISEIPRFRPVQGQCKLVKPASSSAYFTTINGDRQFMQGVAIQ